MTNQLASRVQAIKPSATLALTQRANELRAKGVDVILFGVGEPDFRTPSHIIAAAKEALDNGATGYTAVRGVTPLLRAICDDSERRRGVRPDESEVVVSCGAKHTLYNLATVLYEAGDEVIIPAPFWVSYPDQVLLADATPKIVPTREEDNFLMRPEQLAEAVGPRTKALILCSPSNPTGAAYGAAELEALAEVAAKGDYWIIVDEIYSELVYGGFRHQSLVELAPSLRDRIILVDGVSKTYAMTGWRIGWTIAPPHIAKAIEKIQGQSTTNPAAVSQYAAIAALTGPREPVEEMRAAFAERRDAVVAGLNAIEGIRCREPEGAFYAFPNVSELVGKRAGDVILEDDSAVVGYLLNEAKVALIPGSSFGAPGYMRMSYATSMELIEEGLRRIAAAVAKLG